ncbi:hypothetical protein G7Y79_00001g003180 [Physcia stellaris]|nr:hypothetical protein G7Y79_00001g003180 [Physcia stellaris]
MSGVAEGLAGLTLSAVSVAALFSTCIECFNKLRLFLWGESIGLASRSASANPESYHPGLDDPIISPVILRTLQSIKHLLVETRNLNARYAINERQSNSHRHSRGLDIFRSSFDELEAAFERNQKRKSVKAVTRWAIHDADKFEVTIKRLRGFIDGLQDISKSLGVLSDQQARLKEEIESIADTENLQLICDAAGQEDVADVARQQLQLRRMSSGILKPEALDIDSNITQHGHSISSAETADSKLASRTLAPRPRTTPCSPARVALKVEMRPTQPSVKKTLTDNDRCRICRYQDENPYIEHSETADLFGVERSTVLEVLLQKEKYLSMEGDDETPPKVLKIDI